ncbi:MAG TPA: HAMP domain-containing sensor histidine kinase [Bacteroidales bacterium]|nr:HAMP domain-containing sensor histidine kinase [Bacteroidales bacterium]
MHKIITMEPSYEELQETIKKLKEQLKQKELEYVSQHNETILAKNRAEESEKMLRTLVETAVGTIGQDFFDNIVIKLAEWLNVECVVLGQMFDDNRIYCLPMYLDGNISHDFSYDLANSPCDVTTRKGFCLYPENVIDLFPKDKILVDLGAKGYVGTALYNKNGIANGVICAVSRHELDIPTQTQDILKIIGARVSAEIERKKALQALERSEAKLRESNATKDKFFSIIAHDLKNPFNSILGLSNLLMLNYTKYDAKRMAKMTEAIHIAAKNAYNLLENLLQWSLAQQGMINYYPTKISLPDFVKDNVKAMQNQAQSKRITITTDIDKKIHLIADKDMFSTVLRNLLSNAIKFTPEGGKINIVCSPSENNEIQLSVADNGIGIMPDNLEKIFRIDYSTHGTKTEKGTGLGLILCKEFMEKQNGSIRAESIINEGSKFILTFPPAN